MSNYWIIYCDYDMSLLDYTVITTCHYWLIIRDMHGNRKCGIPIPPVEFAWEWEPNCLK